MHFTSELYKVILTLLRIKRALEEESPQAFSCAYNPKQNKSNLSNLNLKIIIFLLTYTKKL